MLVSRAEEVPHLREIRVTVLWAVEWVRSPPSTC